MATPPLSVLVVGATGSIGRHAVAEALLRGYDVRALLRNTAKADRLPAGVEIVGGDVTQPDTLNPALEGIDAVVLTVNADGMGKAAAEAVYYGGVLNLLTAIGERKIRIALMTTIGVTERQGHYNRTNEGHDWKRRGERLVRASGLPYTIVRPGWFDYNAPGEQKLVMLQGDTRRSGTPADGAIARVEIARVLVASLTSEAANRKSFEIVAEKGSAQTDLDPLFVALAPDPTDALDAVYDLDNMPLAQEPASVRDALRKVARNSGGL